MSAATDPETNGTANVRSKPPFLRRVRIRGYKSIAFCDVTLEPLTILVGRNASGKSNFLDALAFLRDLQCDGLSEAVKKRGGARHILSRDSIARSIVIEIEAVAVRPDIGEWQIKYSIDVRFQGDGLAQIVREQIDVVETRSYKTFGFIRCSERVDSIDPDGTVQTLPLILPDRAFLSWYPSASIVEFISRLIGIHTYNFRPEQIRRLQTPSPGWFLESDGNNLSSVIRTIGRHDINGLDRVRRYLTAITSSIELLDVAKYGDYETVRFKVLRNLHNQALEFDANSMSDGTLRALAALIAAFQGVPAYGTTSLVGIEEPETSLHPAAMRALVDALDEATLRTQILLTTHSAEMLDNPTIKPENIRVVQMIDGETVIAPVDEASVEIVRRNLDTLGGLERQNQLEPDLDDLDRQRHLSQNGVEPKS